LRILITFIILGFKHDRSSTYGGKARRCVATFGVWSDDVTQLESTLNQIFINVTRMKDYNEE
jgi:hypothetical protein